MQPKVFLLFAASGMLCALFYALLSGLGSGRHRVWTGFVDFLFVVVAIALFGLTSAYALSGDIRLFTVIAFCMGLAVFAAGPGQALQRRTHAFAVGLWRGLKRTVLALERMTKQMPEQSGPAARGEEEKVGGQKKNS